MADSTTKTLGVDLAKQVFAICQINHSGHVIRRLELHRDAFCHYLPQLSAGTVVAMVECSRCFNCCIAIDSTPTATPVTSDQAPLYERNPWVSEALACVFTLVRFGCIKSTRPIMSSGNPYGTDCSLAMLEICRSS